MKFILSVLFTILLGYMFYLYAQDLPWWTVVFAGFLGGALFPVSSMSSWFAGFLGIFLLWFLLAYSIDSGNASLLSLKMSTILPFGSPGMTMFAGAVLGGIVSGFGALTGSFLRSRQIKK